MCKCFVIEKKKTVACLSLAFNKNLLAIPFSADFPLFLRNKDLRLMASANFRSVRGASYHLASMVVQPVFSYTT